VSLEETPYRLGSSSPYRRWNLNIIIAWIIALIVSAAPPSRRHHIPEARETEQEARVRYASIAKDLVEVVYDANERPLFSGPFGRAKTVTVLLAIMTYESSFRKDVDEGHGKFAKGDGGRSWCMLQVNLGQENATGKTPNRIVTLPTGGFRFTTDPTLGWGGEDLVADRRKCIRAGLAIVRNSFNACGPTTELKNKLKVYASGKCTEGEKESQTRMGLALLWQGRLPTNTDAEVLRELTAPTTPTAPTTTANDHGGNPLRSNGSP